MPSPKHQPTVPAVPSFSPKLLPKSLPQVAKKPVPGKKQAALAQSKEKVKGGKGKQDVTSAGDLSHASITVLSEKKLFLGQKLTVIQGDLSGVTADAAIHPTNASFSLSGEVGQALEKVGGKEFIQEVKELLAAHGPLESTGAAICPGHHFPAKFVLHCNIPSWSTVNANDSLETSVRNCLSLADEKNIKVLAVPPLVTHRLVEKPHAQFFYCNTLTTLNLAYVIQTGQWLTASDHLLKFLAWQKFTRSL